MEVITTHINADFDTIASMMAARKLYPDAVLVLPGSKEETVKGFLLQSALYSLEMKKLREIDLDKITRLIFVDIRNSSRVGPFRDLIGRPGVDVHVYDHHPEEDADIRGSVEVRMDKKAGLLRQLDVDRIDPNDAPHFLLMDRYNECFTLLNLLLPAQGIHPLDAYRELARVVARLSLLSPGRRAIEVLPYDHENLGPIFYDICEKILRNLDPLVTKYLFEKFVGDGTAMMVRLSPHWFEPQWQWYLGVDKGNQLSEEELDRFLRPPDWNWVFGSRDKVDDYFRISQPGLARTLVTTTVRELPSREKWTYYQISQNQDQSPAFPQIKATHTVAMRIMNHDQIAQGADYVDHQHTRSGSTVRLRFALFALAR